MFRSDPHDFASFAFHPRDEQGAWRSQHRGDVSGILSTNDGRGGVFCALHMYRGNKITELPSVAVSDRYLGHVLNSVLLSNCRCLQHWRALLHFQLYIRSADRPTPKCSHIAVGCAAFLTHWFAWVSCRLPVVLGVVVGCQLFVGFECEQRSLHTLLVFHAMSIACSIHVPQRIKSGESSLPWWSTI